MERAHETLVVVRSQIRARGNELLSSKLLEILYTTAINDEVSESGSELSYRWQHTRSTNEL